MKSLFCLLLISVLPVKATTIDDANNLYRERLNDHQAAYDAAQLYLQFSSRSEIKHQMQIAYFEAMTFYAYRTSDEQVKKTLFKKLTDQSEAFAKEIVPNLFGVKPGELSSDQQNHYAHYLYYYGVSLANFSELDHFTTAVKNWPTVRRSMMELLRLGEQNVHFYGAHRTLGIANVKMPAPFGSVNRAVDYLKIAFEQTFSKKYKTSIYSFNTLHYAIALSKKNLNKEACKLIEDFLTLNDQDLFNMDQHNAPDNILQREEFLGLGSELKC